MCSTTLNQSNPGMLGSPMAEYFKTEKSYYINQLNYMFKEQLYSGVLHFGTLTLSLAEKYREILTESQEVSVVIMCGDAAYFTHDYVRAEFFYRRALQLYKYLSKTVPNLKDALPEDCSNDVKYKLYLCLMQYKKTREALNMLQSIPAKSRVVRTNMALGKLYMQSGMERAAITSFKEVLRECPTSIEAIEALISLGLKESDLQIFFNHKVNKMPHSEWFFTWIKAQQSMHLREYSQAIAMFNNLAESSSLKNNHYLLQALATAYAMNGEYENAIGPLQTCQQNEPSNMSGMDLLAFLFWWSQNQKELEKLMRHLSELNYNESRHEAWIALAYFSQLSGRGLKGVNFAQRALTCSSNKNVEALLCKGYMLLDTKKINEAVDTFREAQQIAVSRFETHDGLVTCYIQMERYRDALAIANFAMKKLGTNPRVLTMIAQPLSKDPLNFAKAKSYLEKALQMNKSFKPAIFTLAEIWEEECHYDKAIHLLSQLAQNGPVNTQVHVRLAQLWSKKNSDDRAADHFAIALKLDPNSRDAREGLSRLDPSVNRSTVHEQTQATSYDLVEDVEIDEDEDDHDLEGVDSELDPAIWEPQPDF